MDKTDIASFVEKLKQDTALADRIAHVRSDAEFNDLINENGFSFSNSQYDAFVTSELSETELDSVTGGLYKRPPGGNGITW
jgi:bacteriocin propeptide, TIGR03798 family